MSVGINHTNSNVANCFETTELRNWRESYSSRIDSILFLFYEPSSSIVRYIHMYRRRELKNPLTSVWKQTLCARDPYSRHSLFSYYTYPSSSYHTNPSLCALAILHLKSCDFLWDDPFLTKSRELMKFALSNRIWDFSRYILLSRSMALRGGARYFIFYHCLNLFEIHIFWNHLECVVSFENV
jgi:hypothetical protein